VPVVRTPVGEAHVAGALKRHDAETRFGGEGNGGVIFPPVTWVRDSLSAMTLILRLIAREGRPLSAIVDDLPQYVMIKRKFDLTDLGGAAAVAPALERVTRRYESAGDDVRIDAGDGVRVDFPDGWVHIRPSNTEPILRLIAEARTADRVSELVDDVAAAAGL